MRPERARAPELRGLEPVDWQERPLGELIECFDQLRVPVKESERRPGRFPYYGASGVVGTIDDYIFHGEHLLIAEDGENLRTRKTPIAFRANGKFWVNNHAHIVRGNEHADTRYLEYALQVADIDAYLTGAVMPKLTQGNMRLIPVAVPPLAEQRAIASILGALDDKIELNRRMNETLEGLARALFKSWFVDFDPVRAKAAGRQPVGMDAETARLFPDRFGSEAHGEVPVGWKVHGLDEIATFLNGLALQKFPAQPGAPSLPVIKIAELRSGITSKSDRASTSVPSQYVVGDGDVLFSWSGSLEVVIWSGGRGALNQHLFKVTSDTYPLWFVHAWVEHHLPAFRTIAADKATTMGHIQRRHLSEAKASVPSPELLARAGSTLEPIWQRCARNSTQSRTLATLRDSLLPKLLSGELRVRDAEHTVEAAT